MSKFSPNWSEENESFSQFGDHIGFNSPPIFILNYFKDWFDNTGFCLLSEGCLSHEGGIQFIAPLS
jgi:hypothetical protein